jgi:hypothetical protein
MAITTDTPTEPKSNPASQDGAEHGKKGQAKTAETGICAARSDAYSEKGLRLGIVEQPQNEKGFDRSDYCWPPGTKN